jgi:hypothetical protein
MIYILFLYFAFVLVYIVFSIIAIYHLLRFGYVGDLTKPVILTYIFISTIIIVTTLTLISFRQWPTTISF